MESKFWMKSSRLSLPALLVLQTGCVLGGILTVSDPQFDDHPSSLSTDDGVIHFDGLSMSVRPQNVDVPVLTGGVLVPVVPLGGGNRVDTTEPFDLVIQFDAKGDGYAFDPAGVVLKVGDLPVQPSAHFGPFQGGYPLTPLSSGTAGHDWGCDLPIELSPESEMSDRFPVSQKQCIVVRFAVNTVSPETDFFVSITGLYADGAIVEPIRISFSKGNAMGVEVLGGQ